MQHGAAVAQRMPAAGREHARDVALGYARSRRSRRRRANSSLASRPADIDSTTDSISTDAMRSARVDRLPDRLLGLGQIDHAAGFHAARAGMAEADHLDGMAPARQHLLRRMRPQPARSGRRSCSSRHRAPRPARCAAARSASSSESGRNGGRSCVAALLLLLAALSASSRACAAASDSRTRDAIGQPQIDRWRCRATAAFCRGRARPAGRAPRRRRFPAAARRCRC